MSIYDFTLMFVGLTWMFIMANTKTNDKVSSHAKRFLFVTGFYAFMYALVNSGVIKIGG